MQGDLQRARRRVPGRRVPGRRARAGRWAMQGDLQRARRRVPGRRLGRVGGRCRGICNVPGAAFLGAAFLGAGLGRVGGRCRGICNVPGAAFLGAGLGRVGGRCRGICNVPGAGCAEVGLHDGGVVRHGFGCALGDDRTEVHGHETVGHVQHQMHVVLHQQHGQPHLRPDPAQQLARLLALAARHTGHGLVEHQQARLGGKGAPDLDALLHPVGQETHGTARVRPEVEEVHEFRAVPPVNDLLAPRPPEPHRTGRQTRPHEGVTAQHQVVDDVEVLEQRQVLERPGHARGGDARRPHADQLRPLEDQGPLVGVVDAADAVEYRRLAGAVGADQGHEFAGAHVERHPVEGLHTAEGQAHALDGQQRRGVRCLQRRSGGRCVVTRRSRIAHRAHPSPR